jgi:serine protease AprX
VTFQDEYEIRVLNLSLGTDSDQSWTVDPLNYAVERAWDAGIAVVVAASNRGPEAETISKPGDDPYVITVGATDDLQTVKLADDPLPDFSSRGPAAEGVAKPDVVAPGGHLVSLRAIGSTIDTLYPDGIDETYRQGSGTSMSTAVVSGAAAAILSYKPKLKPDRLKHVLAATARPVAVDDPYAVGSGMIDARAAAVKAPHGKANQGLDTSTGWGSLDLSRGTVRVQLDDLGGTVLTGLLTAQLRIWDLLNFFGPWDEAAWYISDLAIFPWFVTSWHGEVWEGHNWEGCDGGEPSEDDCFYGHNWEGSVWYGAWTDHGPRRGH